MVPILFFYKLYAFDVTGNVDTIKADVSRVMLTYARASVPFD